MPRRRKLGRPAKMKGKTQLVAFRLPQALVNRLDRYARRMGTGGHAATRADALRFLLSWGLETLEQEEAERPQLVNQLQALFSGSGARR